MFHGEQAVLPSFSFDTGLVPAGSPVQLQLKLSAGGALTADAQAVAGGSGDALAVVGTPGSGNFKLDAHVKLDGMLHVNASGLTYDGPIPGIENIDIAFGGEAMFDPFLLAGAKATVTAPIPEIKLPPIPLPGGLPGNLQITVSTGSVLTTELAGTCAGIDAHTAQFLAKTSTSGTLVLASEIILKIPVIGDKSFPIPAVTVQIPAFEAAMDLGSQTFVGGGAVPVGAAIMAKGGCGAGGGGGGDGGGGGTCSAELDAAYAPVWHPPNGAHTNQCSSAQLQAFDAACSGTDATVATCKAFRQNNASCAACLITDDTSPGYGAVIRYHNLAAYNVAGCVVLEDPSQLTCAKRIEAYFDCLDTACSKCGSDQAATDACTAAADAGVCNHYGVDYETCATTLATGPAATCFSSNDYALFCGQ